MVILYVKVSKTVSFARFMIIFLLSDTENWPSFLKTHIGNFTVPSLAFAKNVKQGKCLSVGD